MPSDRWTRAFALFDEALARPAAERADFLAATCGPDQQLRDEVQALIAAHDLASGIFSNPEARFRHSRSSDNRSPALTPGDQVSVFTIEA